jgi:acetylornithine deacetylase/succinyl-diaminopimelate desuccinylase-like protein
MLTSRERMLMRRIHETSDEVPSLLQRLVRHGATYGSSGQTAMANDVQEYLGTVGISSLRHEVPVKELKLRSSLYSVSEALGESYKSYALRSTSFVRAIANADATGPRLLLNGHLDVENVGEPSRWKYDGEWVSGDRVGNRIVGRGTADMLGAIACYLYTLKVLSVSGWFGDVSVQLDLVFDEEIGGNGTLASLLALEESRRPDFAIIGEPTGGTICGRSRGFSQFEIAMTGAARHMALSSEYDNANRLVADVIVAIERANADIGAMCGNPGSRYISYGLLRGGTDIATPAAEATVAGAMMLPSELRTAVAKQMISDDVYESTGRRIEVNTEGLSFDGHSLTSGILERLIGNARLDLGFRIGYGEFPSPCDARLYEAFRIPAIIMGPGSILQAHAPQEYINVNELEEFCSTLALTISRLGTNY